MGKVLSPSKPKVTESAEEKRLKALRIQEEERAETERQNEIQRSLKEATLVNSNKTGRRSLLSKGSTGFGSVALRPLLGGGG